MIDIVLDDNILDRVKKALGIEGEYQDDISIGVLTRGVADLWNYGSNDGKLSQYFIQRVSQLALQ